MAALQQQTGQQEEVVLEESLTVEEAIKQIIDIEVQEYDDPLELLTNKEIAKVYQ